MAASAGLEVSAVAEALVAWTIVAKEVVISSPLDCWRRLGNQPEDLVVRSRQFVDEHPFPPVQ